MKHCRQRNAPRASPANASSRSSVLWVHRAASASTEARLNSSTTGMMRACSRSRCSSHVSFSCALHCACCVQKLLVLVRGDALTRTDREREARHTRHSWPDSSSRQRSPWRHAASRCRPAEWQKDSGRWSAPSCLVAWLWVGQRECLGGLHIGSLSMAAAQKKYAHRARESSAREEREERGERGQAAKARQACQLVEDCLSLFTLAAN